MRSSSRRSSSSRRNTFEKSFMNQLPDQDSYERAIAMGNDDDVLFDNQEDFLEHNKKCLKRLKKKDIEFIKYFKSNNIYQMDEETWVPFQSGKHGTVFFTKSGNLLLMVGR